jgi:RimJ/RimL family protein N-acetyltransferase
MEKDILPRVEGTDITLRTAVIEDLDSYVQSLEDTELLQMTGTQQEFSRDELASWLKKISVPQSDRVDFMIELNETGELLGEVVLNEIDIINRSANMRIGIQGDRHRGKGYGSTAISLILRYGFESLNLHRIYLDVFEFNARAIHVYEKHGFQREGLERDVLYLNDQFHNSIKMSILEDEFRALYDNSISI